MIICLIGLSTPPLPTPYSPTQFEFLFRKPAESRISSGKLVFRGIISAVLYISFPLPNEFPLFFPASVKIGGCQFGAVCPSFYNSLVCISHEELWPFLRSESPRSWSHYDEWFMDELYQWNFTWSQSPWLTDDSYCFFSSEGWRS